MFRSFDLTRKALTVGIALALTPAVFTAGPWVESHAFPVTTRVQILSETTNETGVQFYVRFRKRRQCDFLGLAWYSGELRIPVSFEPLAGVEAPATRPVGGQVAGPWHIAGLQTLRGTRAWALHRCHPLWTTFTEFYRG